MSTNQPQVTLNLYGENAHVYRDKLRAIAAETGMPMVTVTEEVFALALTYPEVIRERVRAKAKSRVTTQLKRVASQIENMTSDERKVLSKLLSSKEGV